ncbi:MAG: hypothetical protein ACRDM3_01495 [Rubrobacteraceae bacterium]
MRASALVRGGRVVEATRAGKREVDEPARGLEEGRRYSWVEDHLARLDGKEARAEYYAWLMSGGGP